MVTDHSQTFLGHVWENMLKKQTSHEHEILTEPQTMLFLKRHSKSGPHVAAQADLQRAK